MADQGKIASAIWGDLRRLLPLGAIAVIVALVSGVLLWWPEGVEPSFRFGDGSRERTWASVAFVLSTVIAGSLAMAWLARGGAQIFGRWQKRRASDREHSAWLQTQFKELPRGALTFLIEKRVLGERQFEHWVRRDPDGGWFHLEEEALFDDGPFVSPVSDLRETALRERQDPPLWEISPWAWQRLSELLEDPTVRAAAEKRLAPGDD